MNDANTDGDAAETIPSTGPSRKAVAWSLVGVLALTGVVIWATWDLIFTPVRWRDVGYDIVSATEVTGTFDVFLYEDEPVTCHVRALDIDYGEVGIADVDVDPADGSEQRITVEIATVATATTVAVEYCIQK